MRALPLLFLLASALFAAGPPLPTGASPAKIELDSLGNGYVMGTLPDGAFIAKYRLDTNDIVYLRRASNIILAAMAVDAAGALYVTGAGSAATRIDETELRPLNGASTGTFVAKISPSGAIVYATLVGPSSVGDLAITTAGQVILTGEVLPGELAPTPGAAVALNDGTRRSFVAKLSTAGDRLEFVNRGVGGRRIALDAAGNIYTAGIAGGLGEPPVTAGAFQSTHGLQPCGGSGFIGFSCEYAHISKLDPTGSTLLYATFLAGEYGASPAAIAVDPSGNVLLAGPTRSADFPVTAGVIDTTYGATREPYIPTSFRTGIQPPAETGFVAKLNAAGTGLIFATYLGGSKTDRIESMRLTSDAIYLAGNLGSEDMPGARVIKQECLPRGFAVRMQLDGTAIGDVHVLDGYGSSIAVDASGLVRTLTFDALDVSKDASIQICILDAASRTPIQSIAPGQLISIFRPDLIDETLSGSAGADGILPFSLGALTVRIDGLPVSGLPAPLLYASDRQANAVVPYSVAGRDKATINVSRFLFHFAVRTDLVNVGVTDRSPATFQLLEPMDYCGLYSPLFIRPTAFVRNEDGSVNRCMNPARSGSIATIFLNGGGLPTPATISGLIASERTPIGVEVNVNSEGGNVEVVNFSLDPGSVTSVGRLDFRIPTVSSARAIEVTPTIGGKPIAQGSIFLFATP